MLQTVWNFINLPKEITPFEDQYVKRMNGIALRFYWLHLPVFALIAFINNTGPVLAAALTLAALVGPTVAARTFENPRNVSIVHGFTSMCMGAILVHFGQGIVQIEMHFYFFVLLALLAVFANPHVILVAAVTVAVHHASFWAVLPTSVFNYDAPLWVVAIHAGFVVLESIAAIFIARSFFDSVIGLDKLVQARTAELDVKNKDMQLILDNVGDGLLIVNREGHLGGESSAKVQEWFGKPTPGSALTDYIRATSEAFAEWFELGFDDLVSGFMPTAVCLDQLPRQLLVDGRVYEVRYTTIRHDDDTEDEDAWDALLCIFTDATARRQRERAEKEQREILNVFQRILRDRAGFLEFFAEAEELVAWLRQARQAGNDDGLPLYKRRLHTLKGNAAIFGLESIADIAHELEESIEETFSLPEADDLGTLESRWESVRTQLRSLLGEEEGVVIMVDDDEYEHLLRALVNGEDHERLAERIRQWKCEPTQQRLQRLGAQATRIARQLGRPEPQVVVDDNDLRLDPDSWTDFWQNFVHVVRNSVDHGIEPSSEREAAGKPAEGTIRLSSRMTDDHFIIEICDDGRGVDFDALQAKADAQGVRAKRPQDLLFVDGLSSRDEVTDLSGRGVGMAAVLAATQALGGHIDVESEAGKGTTFSFVFARDKGLEPVALVA